jgi:hypothetical protein
MEVESMADKSYPDGVSPCFRPDDVSPCFRPDDLDEILAGRTLTAADRAELRFLEPGSTRGPSQDR